MSATYVKRIRCEYCLNLFDLDVFLHHVRWEHPDSPLAESIILALLDFETPEVAQ